MKMMLMLLLTLLISKIVLVCTRRYDILQPWTITYTTDNAPLGYVIATNGSAEIVSDKGTFVLAFLLANRTVFHITSNLSGLVCTPTMLAVVMQKGNYAGNSSRVVVWKAEPTDPFGAHSPNFNSLDIDETGNLALYAGDRLLWQSFDHPQDILLPGQRLRSGMHLISRADSSYETYFAEVAPNGFILFVIEGRVPESIQTGISDWSLPYGLWTLGGSQENSTLSHATRKLCRGHETVLLYTGSELKLFYEAMSTNSSNCSVPAFYLPLGATSVGLPYVQLTSKGDLVLFSYHSVGWVALAKISDSLGYCKLPSACEQPQPLYDGDNFNVSVCDSNTNRCTYLEAQKNRTLGKKVIFYTDGVTHFSTRFKASNASLNIEMCRQSVANAWHIYDSSLHRCYQTLSQRFYQDDSTIYMTATIEFHTPSGSSNLALDILLGALKIYISMFVSRLVIITVFAVPASYAIKYKLPSKAMHKLVLVKYAIINSLTGFSKAVQETETLLSTMQGLPRRYTYFELELATRKFRIKLGAGGCGSVYKGILRDGKYVAVKRLVDTEFHDKSKSTKQFVTEIAGIGGISHINVVKLYGFCVDGTTRKLLVYEFMPNGSLDGWIFSADRSLNWQQRLDIALGTARALCYMHEECSEPILHLDIKPQNILLDENFAPKVCDFGMAKLFENREMTHATTTVRGTLMYMAPEWLMRSVATKKCDVYSFGLVLLEIIGGRRNTDWSRLKENEDDSSWYFPSWVAKGVTEHKSVLEIWDEKVRSSAAANERKATAMVYLALWCMQSNPSLRPGFNEIVQVLEGQRSIGEPPQSFHFNVGSQDSGDT